jgi:RecB family exonuclease
MSTYFLRRFAEHLLEKHPVDLSRVTVVLPTTRARLFLMRHLHELKGGTYWAPHCIILPEWVRTFLPGRIGSELEMMAAFYEQYRLISGVEGFETFLGWQSIAMRDFNDVDSAMAPSQKVFSDLRNIREIENWDPEAWSFNKTPLSSTQESFLRFWKQLGELYHAFAQWQDSNGCWTYSRAVRYLAENPDVYAEKKSPDCTYFVGLGSYSAAERKLIKNASENGPVEMIWDLDEYYFHNESHEAGAYARKWRLSIGEDQVVDRIVSHALKATVVKCGTSISQVMRAAEILGSLSRHQLDATCVVVNDESALEPLLSAIADLDCDVNLAIGKPLQQTNLSRIAEELIVVRSHHLRKGKIYHRHFVQWLQVIRASGYDAVACERIREFILNENIAQITQEHLNSWKLEHPSLSVLLGALDSESNPREAVQALQAFMLLYAPADEFGHVSRTKMLNVLEDLIELLGSYDYMNNDLVLLKIYQLVIARMKLQYTGEPIEGLQVLSLSETRAIDFERIIFLGANEDYFPGERFDQSFIPFDLRNYYGLPMPEDADAIHSYTYYRLLHEAEEVYYLYSTITADSKSGEPSRYVTQLTSELSKANRNLSIYEEVVGTTDSIGFKEGIESSDFVRERLLALFSSGVSPSAINKLVSCPLDFYYRYIARLGEEKEVDDSISSSKFGEIVHKVLEDFYRPFIGAYPQVDDYRSLRSSLQSTVYDAATELYSGRSLDYGIDHLSMRIAIDMLAKYIEVELESLQSVEATTHRREVKFVEDGVSREFTFSIENKPFTFSLRGKIDRADLIAGVLQVIDYKTGKVGADNSPFKGNFDALFTETKFSKFLQLLVYIMMTRDKNQPVPIASFYSMKESGGSFVHAQDLSEVEIDHAFIDQAEEALARFLHSLLEKTSFEHKQGAKYCEYCLVSH